MSIKLGSTLLAGVATNTVSNANYLLDWKWSDHIINSMEWLRADTFSWQNGSVYTGAYNHILADYNGGTSQTETVGSYTITYVLATDGHKITTDETTVANIYTESGVAWYYILDTANQRFKLPRENPAKEELLQKIGVHSTDYAPTFKFNTKPASSSSGWTLNSSGSTVTTSSLGASGYELIGGLDADMSLASSVYKGNKYLYFYVGQFSQSATEQTAGLNSELFNGKMDLDFNNMNPSQTAKETIVGWGMPDYSSAVSITSVNSITNTTLTDWYTATKDGFVYGKLGRSNAGTTYLALNRQDLLSSGIGLSTDLYSPFFVAVNKGDVLSYKTNVGTGKLTDCFFAPLKGVNNA